jgi:hypothetical protein
MSLSVIGGEGPDGLPFLFFLVRGFFDCHIAKLVRVKNFAAFLAFNEFGVLVARYHANFWVFAGGGHDWLAGLWA